MGTGVMAPAGNHFILSSSSLLDHWVRSPATQWVYFTASYMHSIQYCSASHTQGTYSVLFRQFLYMQDKPFNQPTHRVCCLDSYIREYYIQPATYRVYCSTSPTQDSLVSKLHREYSVLSIQLHIGCCSVRYT
jgi:hypothetical protein